MRQPAARPGVRGNFSESGLGLRQPGGCEGCIEVLDPVLAPEEFSVEIEDRNAPVTEFGQGVSIALDSEIHRVFAQQEWAVQLQSFMLATIVINEVIGPPLMRLGVIRSGEARA